MRYSVMLSNSRASCSAGISSVTARRDNGGLGAGGAGVRAGSRVASPQPAKNGAISASRKKRRGMKGSVTSRSEAKPSEPGMNGRRKMKSPPASVQRRFQILDEILHLAAIDPAHHR